jgi:hypothetical protein
MPEYDAHMYDWAKGWRWATREQTCDERYAKWEWLEAKKLAKWEKKIKRMFGERWRAVLEQQQREIMNGLLVPKGFKRRA